MDAITSHQTVRLRRGAHRSPTDGACVMELVSMLAGEDFTDRPRTACPVIGAFLRPYNDLVGDGPRQELLACASLVVGSRHPGRERERVERCVVEALECHRAQSRWRRRLDGDHRIAALLMLADKPLDRIGLDRFGSELARLVHHGGGPERAVALVADLTAIGAGTRVHVERDGLRVAAAR